jgi:hypothetical protein
MTRLSFGHACGFAALLFATQFAIAQDEGELSGTVIDADGNPVAGAVVAISWNSGGGEQNPQGFMSPYGGSKGGSKTDADGRFTMTLEFYDRSIALLAIDGAQKLGGIAVVDPKQPDAPISIRLAPLIEVRGSFSCDELKRPPGWTNVYIDHKPSGWRLLSCDSSKTTFAFKLPPGDYDFDGYGNDVIGVRKALSLTADKPVLDMGTIDLRATRIAKHMGKEPPAWNITDARGVTKTVKYSDFKGKWVLMEFWGFW